MNQQRKGDRGYLDLSLWVPKNRINVAGVKAALTFEYLEGKDRVPTPLPLYKETEDHLLVPREFWNAGTFDFELVDMRPSAYARSPVRSRIALDHRKTATGVLEPTGKDLQHRALDAMMRARGGILQLACGKGKTVIFLELIARLGVPGLIVVDNTNLMEQWARAIDDFLEVPGGVGLIQADVFDWQKWVVLATYQTLANRAASFPEEVRRWFGVIGWDEAHHVNAPTFSRSADMFYGRRYGLTATPKRDDGLHVIHQFNFGDVVYKDLKQDLTPRIVFRYTCLELNLHDPQVVEDTHSVHGELHLSKLASYFGKWKERRDFVFNLIREKHQEGRKILVLSTSIGELVNLLSLYSGSRDLYTDLSVTPEEVGETLPGIKIDPDALTRLIQTLAGLEEALEAAQTEEEKQRLQAMLSAYETAAQQGEVFKKLRKLLRKKQSAFIKSTLQQKNDAGLMIHKVDPALRMKMLREKDITFAIMKYGKEGLDEPTLDTSILLEPVASQAMLQQIMGRILRVLAQRTKDPEMIVLEDSIPPIRNICEKMRRHLRSWPIEDGGPYNYEMQGYPIGRRTR